MDNCTLNTWLQFTVTTTLLKPATLLLGNVQHGANG